MDGSCLLWSLVAVCSWGICPVLERLGILRANPTVIMFFNALIVAVVLGALCIHRFKNGHASLLQIDASTALLILSIAIIGGLLGEYAYFQAIASAESTGSAVAITSTYPLVTILISILFLGEQITLSSGLGAVMIICGVTLLSTSGAT